MASLTAHLACEATTCCCNGPATGIPCKADISSSKNLGFGPDAGRFQKVAMQRRPRVHVQKVEGIRSEQRDSQVQAEDGTTPPPPPAVARSSILCKGCSGNGAVACSQCEGTGLNSVDHFEGRFKAGATCWLCRGKRQMLCGECNGAGFVGGFMSSAED
eukprot:TRINITY_DN184_c0_g1_i1.p1 TRINITY_DN184_c0_g1~~TRINITY_DN184_c0_g1_i1.p1  ORF type:complete len:159 (-),score=18.57 TRINITY_DN184_c0_g1_i1:358-834(-)